MRAKAAKPLFVVVDTETTGVYPWAGDRAFAVGLLSVYREDFSLNSVKWNYYEWPVNPFTREVNHNYGDLERIAKVLEDATIPKVFFNAKFDIRMLEMFGIQTLGRIEDVYYMAHVCNTLELKFELKYLADRYLGLKQTEKDLLLAETIRARRQAKKLGWKLGVKASRAEDGSWKYQSTPKADYWMVKALDPESKLCEEYNRGDDERTALLYFFYREGLKDLGSLPTYEREMELFPIVYEMETRGVFVSPERIQDGVKHYSALLEKSVKELERLAWKDFNPRSTKQVSKLLYQKSGLVPRKFTKNGNASADADVLQGYRGNPVVDSLLTYRAYKNALVNGFYKYDTLKTKDTVTPGAFAIHTSFQQIGPVTGRFSSREPNLQNTTDDLATASLVPVNTRTPFGPRPGYQWILADYSQIEVRIFADLAQEKNILSALNRGEDIHTYIANKAWGHGNPGAACRAAIHSLELDAKETSNELIKAVWKEFGVKSPSRMSDSEKESVAEVWLLGHDFDIVKAEETIGKKMRRYYAKRITFLKIYGGGVPAIMRQLHCSFEEGQRFLLDYDYAFPRISAYMQEVTRRARLDGYVTTRYGRRLTVDPDTAYRGVNYETQGSAADLIKIAMIKVYRFLKETGLDAHLLLQVHDEILMEFLRVHCYRRVLREVQEIMEDNGGAFTIPTPVDMEKVLVSWNQKSPVVI